MGTGRWGGGQEWGLLDKIKICLVEFNLHWH